jgi:multiple sugar transport system substrate-binding protein
LGLRGGVACLAAAAGVPAWRSSAAQGRYEGQTITVAARDWAAEAWDKYMQDWYEETGVTVEWIRLASQDLQDKVFQSMATGTRFADIVFFPSTAKSDIMPSGYLLEVPQEYIDSPEMDIDDVVPVFRVNQIQYEGKTYAFPFDGDSHVLGFRADQFSDLANKEAFADKYGYELNGETGPNTWTEFRDYSEFFTQTGWNESGRNDDYGFAMSTTRGAGLWTSFFSRASSYAKHPDDKGFFFDLETFEPRINNPAFVRALTEWTEELKNFAPQGGVNIEFQEEIWNAGLVAMQIGWHGNPVPGDSAIYGKDGWTIIPGSNEVYNAKTGEWDTFEEPSHAPYLAFLGWTVGVTKDASNPEACFEMLAVGCSRDIHSQMVYNGGAIQPVRLSELESIEPWMNGPLEMSEETATAYLLANELTITSPNLIIDLAIPGFVQYQDAHSAAVSEAITGAISAQDALDRVADEWNAITERLGGPERQAEFYRELVGA